MSSREVVGDPFFSLDDRSQQDGRGGTDDDGQGRHVDQLVRRLLRRYARDRPDHDEGEHHIPAPKQHQQGQHEGHDQHHSCRHGLGVHRYPGEERVEGRRYPGYAGYRDPAEVDAEGEVHG